MVVQESKKVIFSSFLLKQAMLKLFIFTKKKYTLHLL